MRKPYIFPGSNKIVNTNSVPNYLALEFFTDGSKSDTGTCCSVVYMFKGVIFYTQQFSFDEDIKIFQAEVFAIGRACRFIVDHNVDSTIYTDSKSSIDALTSENCIYEQCCKIIERITEHVTINLVWIKGHSGDLGDDLAEEHVKQAIQEGV